MTRAIVAAGALLLLASACSKVTYVTPEAATEQARGDVTATAGLPTEARTATPRSTPQPTEEPAGRIRPGVWVRVEGADDCLDFRDRPSAGERAAINYCRPDGFEGYVATGPEENDDGRWWFIAGLGWAVEDLLVLDRVEDLSERVVPELEGLGRIAFVGSDGDLWTMNSDGSERARVLDAGALAGPAVTRPVLSPSGQAILYGSSGSGGPAVHIADLFGNDVYVFENSTLASWSPDGTRIALLYDVQEMEGGSISATPSVVDLATGDVTPIGPSQFSTAPVWRPDSGALLYSNRDGDWLATSDDSPPRSVQLPGTVPNWSPDGDRVSVAAQPGAACGGYVVYSVERNEVDRCAPTPRGDDRRGERDSTPEDGQTDWSPDGRFFAYHTEWAVQDRSGVYVVDVETGDQTLLPGWQAAFTSFSADGRYVVFSTRGGPAPSFIWIGDRETGEVILLAEGSEPSFVAD